MVFAVQCPSEKCRKFQLVEDHERGKVVYCLLCKAAIRAGAPPAIPPGPPPVRRPPSSRK